MSATARLALPYPTGPDTADVPRDIKALADRVEALTAWIRAQDMVPGAGILQPGDLKISAIAASHTGFLLCDGASYLRTDWPDLFAAIGGAASPWGLPDGTHFNVPDCRGQVPIGVGTGTGLTARAMGTKYGAETHQLTRAQLADHSHDPFVAGNKYVLGVNLASFAPGSGSGNGIAGTTWLADATGSNQGGPGLNQPGQAHNNVQPSLGLNFFIKT